MLFTNACIFYFARFKFEDNLFSKREESKNPWWHTSIKVDEFNEEVMIVIKSVLSYI